MRCSILKPFFKAGYTHFAWLPLFVRDWYTDYKTYVFIWLRWYSIVDSDPIYFVLTDEIEQGVTKHKSFKYIVK